MRVPQPLVLLPLAIALLAAGAACGGGSGTNPPDSDAIPTATAPDPLPEARIIGRTSPEPEGTTYTVESGDTPGSIAGLFGISAEELMAANGITDPTSLEVGQVLTVPGVADGGQVLGATQEPPSPTSTPEPEPVVEPTIYVVQEGDIPATIAAQFGITAEELMAANGITDPTGLFIGQELVIPTPAP